LFFFLFFSNAFSSCRSETREKSALELDPFELARDGTAPDVRRRRRRGRFKRKTKRQRFVRVRVRAYVVTRVDSLSLSLRRRRRRQSNQIKSKSKLQPMAAVAGSLVVELGEPFLAGCVFYLGHATATPRDRMREMEKQIAHHGGRCAANVEDAGTTHAVMEQRECREYDYWRAREKTVVVVHPEWLNACLRAKRVLDLGESVLYSPPQSLRGVDAMRDCVVCVTGYTGERRRDVETMARVLGAKFQKAYDRTVTHLVCFEHEGAKWARAKELKQTHIVNHRWLEESVAKWTRADEGAFARSGKEEDELALYVPDSEDDEEDVEKESSVIPESISAEGAQAEPVSEVDTVLAYSTQREGAPSTVSKKTPSTLVRSGAKRSASKSVTKISFRSPDWEEEARRGAHIARSVRNRIDPSLKRAIKEGGSQPAEIFTGLIGSPNDVEAAFGGRFAPSNAWFSFFDDADQEPLTDSTSLDDFYSLLSEGRRQDASEDTETRMQRIRAGEIRFDVFVNGISERIEEDILQPDSGLVMQTLYSGTVVLLAEDMRDMQDEVIKLVDKLESEERSGPLGAIVLAKLRVETAKQPVCVGERLKAGPDALLATLFTYVKLAHGFTNVHTAQLFNEDGSLAAPHKTIVLPQKQAGNLRGVIIKSVERTFLDVLAGYYELLAGPTEPDPTQRFPSQRALSEEEDEQLEDLVPTEDQNEDHEILRINEEALLIEPEVVEEQEEAQPEPPALESEEPEPEPEPTRPKRARTTAAKASTSKPAAKKTEKTPSRTVKKTKKSEEHIAPKPKAYITLSGFSSAGIKKYSSIVRRVGGILVSGHEWEAPTTHVVFGERGSRSIKFLAGAVAGASLVDVAYLDACSAAGELLPVADKYLWKGGRGAEMGVISSGATSHWNTVSGSSAFEGLSIAMLPFAPKSKDEQRMLDTVLRAGGASLSSVSSKGDVCLTQAEFPDLVISDQVDAAGSDDIPRLGSLLETVKGIPIVSPEFFKSWISTPELALEAHCLFDTASRLDGEAIQRALSRRGKVKPITKVGAPTQKEAPFPSRTKKTTVASKRAPAAVAAPALSQQRQTRAKRAANAPLATRVRSKRRAALKESN